MTAQRPHESSRRRLCPVNVTSPINLLQIRLVQMPRAIEMPSDQTRGIVELKIGGNLHLGYWLRFEFAFSLASRSSAKARLSDSHGTCLPKFGTDAAATKVTSGASCGSGMPVRRASRFAKNLRALEGG